MILWCVFIILIDNIVAQSSINNTIKQGRWTRDEQLMMQSTTLFCIAQCIGLSPGTPRKQCYANIDMWNKFITEEDQGAVAQGEDVPPPPPPMDFGEPPPFPSDDFPPP